MNNLLFYRHSDAIAAK